MFFLQDKQDFFNYPDVSGWVSVSLLKHLATVKTFCSRVKTFYHALKHFAPALKHFTTALKHFTPIKTHFVPRVKTFYHP